MAFLKNVHYRLILSLIESRWSGPWRTIVIHDFWSSKYILYLLAAIILVCFLDLQNKHKCYHYKSFDFEVISAQVFSKFEDFPKLFSLVISFMYLLCKFKKQTIISHLERHRNHIIMLTFSKNKWVYLKNTTSEKCNGNP